MLSAIVNIATDAKEGTWNAPIHINVPVFSPAEQGLQPVYGFQNEKVLSDSIFKQLYSAGPPPKQATKYYSGDFVSLALSSVLQVGTLAPRYLHFPLTPCVLLCIAHIWHVFGMHS